MILNENEKCPVCDKLFTKDDDIVFCPHCGTPHHRECYNATGHCINADKHNTDFEYKTENSSYVQPKDDTTKYNLNNEYYHPEDNTESDDNQKYRPFGPAGSLFSAGKTAYEKSNETIDGRSMSEVACVISTNVERFIKKFKANKLFSWNWGAFFFGPYYLFFRKMNFQGLAFLALNYAVSFAVQGFYYEKISKFYDFMNSNMNKMNEIVSDPNGKLGTEMMSLYQEILPVAAIIMIASLVIHIIIALFADKIYRQKVLTVIDKVNSNLDEGATFTSAFPMMNDEKISQQDMKKLYLSKLGGTSIFLPLMIYAAIMLISLL